LSPPADKVFANLYLSETISHRGDAFTSLQKVIRPDPGKTLEQDPAYIIEYDRFVKGVPYASVDVPTFMLFISSGNVLLIASIHKRWIGGE
jgi:hypothetical protein